MKIRLLVPALFILALLAGCAIGPTDAVVVNPFDWSAPSDAAATPPRAVLTVAAAQR